MSMELERFGDEGACNTTSYDHHSLLPIMFFHFFNYLALLSLPAEPSASSLLLSQTMAPELPKICFIPLRWRYAFHSGKNTWY